MTTEVKGWYLEEVQVMSIANVSKIYEVPIPEDADLSMFHDVGNDLISKTSENTCKVCGGCLYRDLYDNGPPYDDAHYPYHQCLNCDTTPKTVGVDSCSTFDLSDPEYVGSFVSRKPLESK